jgi:hypothetical protein
MDSRTGSVDQRSVDTSVQTPSTPPNRPIATPPPAGGTGPSKRRARFWRVPWWVLIVVIWVAIALLFAVISVLFQRAVWSTAWRFSLFDWGPWIVLSPLVVWLARKFAIDHRTWRWALPVHVAISLALTFALDAAFQIAFTRQWIELPRPRMMPLPPPPGAPTGGIGHGAGGHPAEAGAIEIRRERGGVINVWRGDGPPEGATMRIEPGGTVTRLAAGEGRFIAAVRMVRARFMIPIYFVIVAATHAVAYHRRSLERERQAGLAETQLQEARLLALQMQLQPHFLFNTLNTISGFIYEKPRIAEEMICALGDLLRSAMDISQRLEISLEEELRFIEHYLQIQRLRFPDRLDVQLEIAPGLETAGVPPLLLQPLVENAVVHGITPHQEKGCVRIVAAKIEGRLRLTVSHTGRGNSPIDATARNESPPGAETTGAHERAAHASERRTASRSASRGIGLGNTRARLATLYGSQAQLEATLLSDGGFRTEVNIPFRSVSPETCAY